jgi:hypothetical protein
MKKLIAKVNTAQRSGLNPKTLFVYENESGTVGYRYLNNQGTSFAISNMQCGWRGPNLPDCIYDYNTPGHLIRSVVKAVNGGVQEVTGKKVYIKEFNFAN